MIPQASISSDLTSTVSLDSGILGHFPGGENG